MNEWTHFFIKIYLSHFILSHLGWGHSTMVTEGPKPLCLPLALNSASCPPTDSNWLKPSVSWLYFCLMHACFRCFFSLFTQVHLLIDGSVECQYVTIGYFFKTRYEVHTISFQTFFVWALLLIVYTWNSSPLWSNLLRLQCTCCTIPTTSGRPHGSPLVWACQWPSSQPLSSPQLSHNDSLWA